MKVCIMCPPDYIKGRTYICNKCVYMYIYTECVQPTILWNPMAP